MSETRAITPTSRVPLGQRGRFGSRGKRLCDCSDSFLRWLASPEMRDSDLAAWSVAAAQVLEERAKAGRAFVREDTLQAQADSILRNAGYGRLARRH